MFIVNIRRSISSALFQTLQLPISHVKPALFTSLKMRLSLAADKLFVFQISTLEMCLILKNGVIYCHHFLLGALSARKIVRTQQKSQCYLGCSKTRARRGGEEENQISYHTSHKDWEKLVFETEYHHDKLAWIWPNFLSPHY